MVGCQDKEAMAELEAMKAQAEVEEQNKALNAIKGVYIKYAAFTITTRIPA